MANLITAPSTKLLSKVTRRTRAIELKDLVVPLRSCSNFQVGDNKPKYLIDINRVIEESFVVIDQQLQTESIQRDPLVFSSVTRSGKTTVLMSLFDALKVNGYLAMIISFNSPFESPRQSEETEEQAIMRRIVSQLIDHTAFTEDERTRLECDELTLSAYLDSQSGYGSSSSTIPVVLLIDGLHRLGLPLQPSSSELLQRLFLKKNRYLVYSTSIPFSLSSNPAEIKVGRTPCCTDVLELRKMEGCSALTGHDAVVCCGNPGLVYSVVKYGHAPAGVFCNIIRAIPSPGPYTATEREDLKGFLHEVLHGTKINHEEKQRTWDRFGFIPEVNKIRWPLCYLGNILSNLAIPGSGIRSVIENIWRMSERKPAEPFSAMVDESILDWQVVVEVSLLLWALNAVVNETKHPLVPSLAKVKVIEFLRLAEDYTLLNKIEGQSSVEAFIEKWLGPDREAGRLAVIRCEYDKFPLFDGFLVATLPNGEAFIRGYQVNLNRPVPRLAIPDWVNGGGILLRGIPGVSPSNIIQIPPQGWEFPSEAQLKELLGYSLSPLFPSTWMPGVH